MARLVAFSALLLVCYSSLVTGSTFDESNPIRLVSDRLSEIVEVVGNTRRALTHLLTSLTSTYFCFLKAWEEV
ncbi:unnamed protein product [Rhodiola kirilowii]